MATIKFLTQSRISPANIYLRLSIADKKVFKRKTGFTVNLDYWSQKKGQPLPKSSELKNLKSDLGSMANKLEVKLNQANKRGIKIDGDWLQDSINEINNIQKPDKRNILVNYIQHIIDNAHRRPNQRGGLGLSERRVKGYITFKGVVERFQEKKSYQVLDVNLKFAERFKDWMFENGFSINYVGKNLDNLKSVCYEAERNGIDFDPSFKLIKSFTEKKEPSDIIFLSDEEQELIADLDLIRDSLINARRWLLLGCQLGQRFIDLMGISERNIKQLDGIRVVEIRQTKGNKQVVVPLLPEAEAILNDGIPRKLSNAKFNVYIKELCQLAGLDQPMKGKVREKGKSTTTSGIFPKYRLIGSHVCRRSFATNFYGKIPTPVLKNITGHSTERMFLNYIGKTSYDNAYQMVEHFERLKQRTKEEPTLRKVQ